MSFVGIDAGTTGCKVLVFSENGTVLSQAYTEYRIQRSQPGRAELDSSRVWEQIATCIQQAAAQVPPDDPPKAAAAVSMGEAVVPVTNNREILGPSLLNIDVRGNEYLSELEERLSSQELFSINGNTWGEQYGATKLMWLRDREPELYDRTDWFLNWSGFISFMLGADPFVDRTLANRSLLFDIHKQQWSEPLVNLCALDMTKLPPVAASGLHIGEVSQEASRLTGLPKGTAVVTGAHDQCASAVGCGVIKPGEAFYGLGTFPCIVPVFEKLKHPEKLMSLGLNIEHHAAAGRFVSFLYHMGGEIVRWYRDLEPNRSISSILEEARKGPSRLLMLPYLVPTGPPDFISDQSGLLLGMSVHTTRSDILKAVIEANAMALLEVFEKLPEAGISVQSLRAAGGGSRSDITMQICSSILGKPLERPNVTEAGAMGAGLLSAAAAGIFSSLEEAADQMLRVEQVFEPEEEDHRIYKDYFRQYKELKSLTADCNRKFTRFVRKGID